MNNSSCPDKLNHYCRRHKNANDTSYCFHRSRINHWFLSGRRLTCLVHG